MPYLFFLLKQHTYYLTTFTLFPVFERRMLRPFCIVGRLLQTTFKHAAQPESRTEKAILLANTDRYESSRQLARRLTPVGKSLLAN